MLVLLLVIDDQLQPFSVQVLPLLTALFSLSPFCNSRGNLSTCTLAQCASLRTAGHTRVYKVGCSLV